MKYHLEQLRQDLLLLTYIYGYRSGRFTLTSGRASNYYIDGKQVTHTAGGLYRLASYILGIIKDQQIPAQAVGGLTLGADPIAAAVSILSHLAGEQDSLSSFIVRKTAKSHGTGSKIEGPLRRGMQTVIVDDVLTTGGSVLAAAKAVEDAGGRVNAVFVLADRMEGGSEAVKKAGYQLYAAITREELASLQEKMTGRYPGLFKALENEPVEWSTVPWSELNDSHPEVAAEMVRLSPDHLSALDVLKVIKAVELHPEGKVAGLAMLKTLQS